MLRFSFRAIHRRYQSTTSQPPLGAPLLNVVNKLQLVSSQFDATSDLGLKLPQIVVIGSQSSGKTSVLERIVGVSDFLPRGTNIVTRCPLICQLSPNHVDNDSEPLKEGDEAYGVFGHDAQQRRLRLDEVRREVAAETRRIAGDAQDVSAKPIILRLFVPRALPLTLVDLPGMARVPVGAQPADIGARIERIVERYVAPDNAIIMAVHPANTDVATSDGLQMAKRVDPGGARTLGVLTKVDLLDRGTESSVVSLLDGRTFPLRLGFVAVVNRSAADTVRQKPMQAALADEAAFFSHSKWESVRAHTGVPRLATTLNRLLTHHVRAVLPAFRDELRRTEQRLLRELEQYGDPLPASARRDRNAQQWYVAHLCTKYCEAFNGMLGGDVDKSSPAAAAPTASTSSSSSFVAAPSAASSSLNGGARLRYIFNEVFSAELDRITSSDELSAEALRVTIRNFAGPSASLFVPEAAFAHLVHGQIARFAAPVRRCADMVAEELLSLANNVEAREVRRFADLHERILEVAASVVRDNAEQTHAQLKRLLEYEQAFINTSHPRFAAGSALGLSGGDQDDVTDADRADAAAAAAAARAASGGGGGGGLAGRIFGRLWSSGGGGGGGGSSSDAATQPPKQPSFEPNTFSDRELRQIRIMRRLLDSYLAIVRDNLRDLVPKVIMYQQVGATRAALLSAMIEAIRHERSAETLLRESDDAVERRAQAEARLKAVRAANAVLMEANVLRLMK